MSGNYVGFQQIMTDYITATVRKYRVRMHDEIFVPAPLNGVPEEVRQE